MSLSDCEDEFDELKSDLDSDLDHSECGEDGDYIPSGLDEWVYGDAGTRLQSNKGPNA